MAAKKKKDKRHIVIKTIKVPKKCYPKKADRKAHCVKAHTRKVKDIADPKIEFDALVKEVAKEYEGKPVPLKYQKEYGKVYSKADAIEVGKKVAGKQRAGFFKRKGVSMKVAKGGVVGCMDWIITGKHKL